MTPLRDLAIRAVGQRQAAALSIAIRERNDALRLGIRQRSEQDPLHGAEDGRARAYANANARDGNQRETRARKQSATSVTKISAQQVHDPYPVRSSAAETMRLARRFNYCATHRFRLRLRGTPAPSRIWRTPFRLWNKMSEGFWKWT